MWWFLEEIHTKIIESKIYSIDLTHTHACARTLFTGYKGMEQSYSRKFENRKKKEHLPKLSLYKSNFVRILVPFHKHFFVIYMI